MFVWLEWKSQAGKYHKVCKPSLAFWCRLLLYVDDVWVICISWPSHTYWPSCMTWLQLQSLVQIIGRKFCRPISKISKRDLRLFSGCLSICLSACQCVCCLSVCLTVCQKRNSTDSSVQGPFVAFIDCAWIERDTFNSYYKSNPKLREQSNI